MAGEYNKLLTFLLGQRGKQQVPGYVNGGSSAPRLQMPEPGYRTMWERGPQSMPQGMPQQAIPVNMPMQQGQPSIDELLQALEDRQRYADLLIRAQGQ